MTDQQNEPIMAGADDAALTEKVEGVLAQVKADSPDASSAEIAELLRERLGQAGLEVDDEEIGRLAAWEAGES
ncbi:MULTISPECIES: hypothetical protein [Herbiconiux]|jgi:hypothetical protein|uniref:Uncharacterized protein n=1 Tax=Herbiconiux flava TaxID=881268 RepID=A0A852SHE9_9MICO|nr:MULTISPECIES: hypothetical protein [Herbiconiux]NQX35402.1 hypothetical protein [Herbiconiux sp. VKM Ac-2851]NYD69054.1 hypothetical protein [Herbiconiux flava]GLK15802.1 hypothetical protein GCM10017602_02840 [Herbiconiux flava]